MSAPIAGVATVPGPMVPTTISASIRSSVAAVLGDLPKDAKGAIVGVATEKGMNLAVAYKLDSGWSVGAWVGKSGWKQPVAGGVVVQKVFR